MRKHISNIQSKLVANKTIVQNFSFLSVLQVFNLIIPLITFPYLIRVLGKETYGLVIYAQVVVTYLQIIVNFGFNTSAIKEISNNRENKEKISEIIISTYTLKGFFFFLSVILLFTILLFLPQAKNNKMLFFLSMWICFYDFIFPIWYFQGVEKMKYITYLTVISRSIFLSLIFVFITKPEHFLRLPIINGLGVLIVGVLSLVIIFKKERIVLFIPKIRVLYNYMKSSMNFFISDVSISVFASSNKLIIGSFLGLTELAYYDLSERIINIFRTVPLNIVKNTIYPSVARSKNMEIVKKTTQLMSIYSVIAILLLNIFAYEIVILLGGKELISSVFIVRILSLTILTTHLSNYYVTIGLWSLGFDNKFRNLMINSSLFYLILYGILYITNFVSLVSITVTPILVDLYMIIHIFFIFKTINKKS